MRQNDDLLLCVRFYSSLSSFVIGFAFKLRFLRCQRIGRTGSENLFCFGVRSMETLVIFVELILF